MEQKKKEFEETIGLEVLKDMDAFQVETGEAPGEMDIEGMITKRGATFLESSLTELLEKAKECVPERKEPVGEKNPLVVVINANNFGHNTCRESTLQALDNLTK